MNSKYSFSGDTCAAVYVTNSRFEPMGGNRDDEVGPGTKGYVVLSGGSMEVERKNVFDLVPDEDSYKSKLYVLMIL